MRVLIAGIVGGVLIFICGAIAHMATDLGTAGVSAMAPEREAAALDAMKGAMSERKVYFFPGVDMSDAKARESVEYKQKIAAGPSGIVAFTPGPGAEFGARFLGTEFLFNVLEGLIAAFVVAHLATGTSYPRRVLIVGLIGLSGSISIDGSYWNWYRFPDDYFGAQLAMAVGSSLIAGLAIAKLAYEPAA